MSNTVSAVGAKRRVARGGMNAMMDAPPAAQQIGGHTGGENQKSRATKRRSARGKLETGHRLPSDAENSEIGGQKMFENQRLNATKRRSAEVTVQTSEPLPSDAPIPEIAGHTSRENHLWDARKCQVKFEMISDLPDAPNSEIAGHVFVENHHGRARKRQATSTMETTEALPDAPHSEFQPGPPSGAERREATSVMKTSQALPLAETVAALRELQPLRVHCIKQQSRCDRATEAFIARSIGYKTDLSEDERKELFKKAASIRNAVEKGGQNNRGNQAANAPSQTDDQVSSVCGPIILASAQARKGFDSLRKTTEAEMRTLAKTLPAWLWVENVKGFGPLGLAIVIGETGDLANYRTKERVWKRLGLAVIDGERQQKRSGEAGILQAYNPRRRAEIWTLFSDSMFRAQWNGDKDEDGKDPKKTKKTVAVPAHPAGPYGEVYLKRRLHTASREWTPGHRKADALRVMTKAVIEDLWRVWSGKQPIYGKHENG